MKKVILGLFVLMLMLLHSLSIAEEKGGKAIEAGITIEQAIDIGKKEVPGKVIEAEIEDGIYEIKIRTDNGERVKLKIDPKDGSIIRKGKIVKGLSKDFSKP